MVAPPSLPALRLLLGILFVWPGHPQAADARTAFTLGVISERPDAPSMMLREYREMLDYLQDRLKAHRIPVGEIAVAADLEQMRDWIDQGRIDALMESLVATLTLERETGAIHPDLIAWRRGQREYRTVFFSRSDGPIHRLEDLPGHSIVFESPRSTSAYFIPRLTLEHRGIRLSAAESEVPPNEVSYLFAGSELNEAYWVQRGKADAGAFNDGDWERTPATVRKDLRIFHRTPPVLRYLWSFRAGLSPGVRESVRTALLHMHESDAGRAALARANGISRFESLKETDRAQLSAWRAMLAKHGH